MANHDTIAQCTTLPGAAQGASSTSEFYFDDKDAADAIVSLNYDQLKRREFVVRAHGRVVGPVAGNFTVNLDAGDNAAFASNTTIGTSGAVALDANATITSWNIEAKLKLSETDSKLQGEFAAWVNNTITARTAITESIEDLVATGKISFKVSGTFSASDVGNYAICDALEVDLV